MDAVFNNGIFCGAYMNIESLIETHLQKLGAEFSASAISWRAQHVTKQAPYKALALAYIDARDVMKRLDEVCGITGWQRRYTHANGKTICEIGIKCGHEWIWKADGAGDTDIEAEKGAISDAFKRAAVSWGIGRYLYDMEAVWVPCEVDQNGKFKKFDGDPWEHVKHKSLFKNAALRKQFFENVLQSFENAKTETQLDEVFDLTESQLEELRATKNEYDVMTADELEKRYELRLKVIRGQKAAITAGYPDEFNKIGATQ